MPEDKYDFAGLNPANLLMTDKRGQLFDYEERIRQQGYEGAEAPDLPGLFSVLATEYTPSVVVNLPPRVIEKVKLVHHPAHLPGGFLGVLLILAMLILNIFLPYQEIVNFEMKTHMQPARCTVTSAHTDVSPGSDGGEDYSPVLAFTLHTPGGQLIQTTDNDPPTFAAANDVQAYLSRHQIYHTYTCWYSPANPIIASFTKDLGWSDYVKLVLSIFFLLPGLILALTLAFYAVRRGLSAWRQRQQGHGLPFRI